MRAPVEAKAHGAWLGAGSGVGLAQAIVAVIQAITGHPLAQGYVTGIYVLAGPLLAFVGAYLAPHTSRSVAPGTTLRTGIGIVKFEGNITPAQIAAVKDALDKAIAAERPPPATTTGPASPGGTP